MANRFIMLIASPGISFVPSASIISASVSSGSDFHVDHAVFFQCLATLDTVLQPIKAWDIGHMTYVVQGSHLSGGLPGSKNSYQFQILVPVHIQLRLFLANNAKTSTSVSSVQMSIR